MVDTRTTDRTGRTTSVTVVVTDDEPSVSQHDGYDDGSVHGVDDESMDSWTGRRT